MFRERNTWYIYQAAISNTSGFVGNLVDAADLSPGTFEGKDFNGFDLAVVGSDFHHSKDPILVTPELGERLKQGGVLVILDFFVDEQNRSDGQRAGDCHGHGAGQNHGHGNVDEAAKI